jgi:hypothetical protein
MPQGAQLLQGLDLLSGDSQGSRNAQKPDTIGIQPDMSLRTEAMWQSGPSRRKPSRSQGIGARLKYKARPRVADHLDDIRIEEFLGRLQLMCGRGIAASGSASRANATASIKAGSSRGSSPWTLTTISFVPAQASAQPQQFGRCRWDGPLASKRPGSPTHARIGDPFIVGGHPDAVWLASASPPRRHARSSACRRCPRAAFPAAGSMQ